MISLEEKFVNALLANVIPVVEDVVLCIYLMKFRGVGKQFLTRGAQFLIKLICSTGHIYRVDEAYTENLGEGGTCPQCPLVPTPMSFQKGTPGQYVQLFAGAQNVRTVNNII